MMQDTTSASLPLLVEITELDFTFSTSMHEFVDDIHHLIQRIPSPIITYHHNYHTLMTTGGTIHVLVEGIIFLVHSYFFERDSLWWQRSFTNTHQPKEAPVPGQTPYNPIDLSHLITAKQFCSYLWMLYSPDYLSKNTTMEEWGHILHVATSLGMEDIRPALRRKYLLEYEVLKDREEMEGRLGDFLKLYDIEEEEE